jgi:hypothetical protein
LLPWDVETVAASVKKNLEGARADEAAGVRRLRRRGRGDDREPLLRGFDAPVKALGCLGHPFLCEAIAEY